MKIRRLATLVRQNVRRSARSLILGSAGIAAGVASLTFFLGLGEGARNVLLGEIFPVDQLDVIPRDSDGGGLFGLIGGGAVGGIDEATVARLRRIRGVRAVYPRMRLRFPAQGIGRSNLLGRQLAAGEMPGEGVDVALLRADLRPTERFGDPETTSSFAPCARDADCTVRGEYCRTGVTPTAPAAAGATASARCELPVPVVISRYALELYNTTIAPAHGTKRIGEWIVARATSYTFTLELGRSLLGVARQGQPTQVRARLAGISPRAIDLGVTLPLEVVRRWNLAYAGERAASEYASVTVIVRSQGHLTGVSSAVKRMGLSIKEGAAEQIGELITLITVLLTLVSVVIVGIAAVSVAHTFLMLVSERRTEIALFRALGASRGDIRALILAEAAVVGAAATAVGILCGIGGSLLADVAAAGYLPEFSAKPHSYFQFSPAVLGAALAFGLLFSLLGAYFPARRAARLDPAAALSGL